MRAEFMENLLDWQGKRCWWCWEQHCASLCITVHHRAQPSWQYHKDFSTCGVPDPSFFFSLGLSSGFNNTRMLNPVIPTRRLLPVPAPGFSAELILNPNPFCTLTGRCLQHQWPLVVGGICPSPAGTGGRCGEGKVSKPSRFLPVLLLPRLSEGINSSTQLLQHPPPSSSFASPKWISRCSNYLAKKEDTN